MSLDYVGEVLQLFISIQGIDQRVKQDKLFLEKGGIVKDKFFSKHENREVLLATIDSYSLAKKNNIDLLDGQLGENLLMDFNPYTLDIGQQIQIGEVILEISLYCPTCNHLSKVDKSLPNLLKEDRGIFAKVLTRGIIKQGDKIYLRRKGVSKNIF